MWKPKRITQLLPIISVSFTMNPQYPELPAVSNYRLQDELALKNSRSPNVLSNSSNEPYLTIFKHKK